MVESRFYHRHMTLDDLTFNAPDMGHTLKKCAPVESRKKTCTSDTLSRPSCFLCKFLQRI